MKGREQPKEIPSHDGQPETAITTDAQKDRFAKIAHLATVSTDFTANGLYKSQALPSRKQNLTAWENAHNNPDDPEDFNPMAE